MGSIGGKGSGDCSRAPRLGLVGVAKGLARPLPRACVELCLFFFGEKGLFVITGESIAVGRALGFGSDVDCAETRDSDLEALAEDVDAAATYDEVDEVFESDL